MSQIEKAHQKEEKKMLFTQLCMLIADRHVRKKLLPVQRV